MTSRKFTLTNDSFFYPGSMTSGPVWGSLLQGSRAERLHRGRPAINRRTHRTTHRPEDEGGEGGGSEQARQTVNNWTSEHQSTDSNSPSATDRHDTTLSGNVTIDDKVGLWQQLEAVASLKSICENDVTSSVEQRTVTEVVVSSGYVEADDAETLRVFFDQWLPVTVVSCGSNDREPESVKGTRSREAAHGSASRPGPRNERRKHAQDRMPDREPQTSIHESPSLAKTIIRQKASGRNQLSRSTNSLLPSAEWSNDSDINRSYSVSNSLSNCFRKSDPWESKTMEQSRSSTTQTVSNCYRAETQTAYCPTSAATQLGPRSSHGGRDYYGESPLNFGIMTKSIHGDSAGETRGPSAAMQGSGETMAPAKTDEEVLGKAQRQLGNERLTWHPEINRSLDSAIATDDLSARLTSFEGANNSYVDTSTPVPIFKASVEVRMFPPETISVHFDRYTNDVMVQVRGCCCCCEGKEEEEEEEGEEKRTFAAQTIPLPRYADDTQLTARINTDGVLGIEVPLVFYFPE